MKLTAVLFFTGHLAGCNCQWAVPMRSRARSRLGMNDIPKIHHIWPDLPSHLFNYNVPRGTRLIHIFLFQPAPNLLSLQ
jgi:hypothetical protein